MLILLYDFLSRVCTCVVETEHSESFVYHAMITGDTRSRSGLLVARTMNTRTSYPAVKAANFPVSNTEETPGASL